MYVPGIDNITSRNRKHKKRKGVINLSLTVAGTGIEPVFAPWKGAVLTDRRTGHLFCLSGRKNRLMTLFCQIIFENVPNSCANAGFRQSWGVNREWNASENSHSITHHSRFTTHVSPFTTHGSYRPLAKKSQKILSILVNSPLVFDFVNHLNKEFNEYS